MGGIYHQISLDNISSNNAREQTRLAECLEQLANQKSGRHGEEVQRFVGSAIQRPRFRNGNILHTKQQKTTS